MVSTEASLEEEDMGLSAVRVSSCPLKEERASGDDRVEETEETEGAGWGSMSEVRVRVQGIKQIPGRECARCGSTAN